MFELYIVMARSFHKNNYIIMELRLLFFCVQKLKSTHFAHTDEGNHCGEAKKFGIINSKLARLLL
ncbi:hypothetical protein J2Y03_003439 [Neobacillus niacini]|nr:hypothetical protein [Neobacillus niacini]